MFRLNHAMFFRIVHEQLWDIRIQLHVTVFYSLPKKLCYLILVLNAVPFSEFYNVRVGPCTTRTENNLVLSLKLGLLSFFFMLTD